MFSDASKKRKEGLSIYKKCGLILVLLFCGFLSACGEKTTIFSGENKNWIVHYEFIKKGESVKDTGYIKYIGPEPAPNMMEYNMEGKSGNDSLNGEGIIYLGIGGCEYNCYFPSEDKEFKVIIKWDDRSETVTLTAE